MHRIYLKNEFYIRRIFFSPSYSFIYCHFVVVVSFCLIVVVGLDIVCVCVCVEIAITMKRPRNELIFNNSHDIFFCCCFFYTFFSLPFFWSRIILCVCANDCLPSVVVKLKHYGVFFLLFGSNISFFLSFG